MKALLLLVLVSTVASLAFARGAARGLLQTDDDFLGELAGGEPLGSTSTECSAFSKLDILILSGSCSGRAAADCEAVAEAQNAFNEAYVEWWIGDDGNVDTGRVCDSGLIEAAAEAVATAVAQVFTTAVVKVSCTGEGFACGYAISDGTAFAIAFAEAIALAAADASQGDIEAWCVADIRALASAFAQAADRSRAETCTTGGTEEDFQMSYASAVVDAIATALARASATACNADAAKAESECFGRASSTTDEIVEGPGKAAAVQVTACEGGAAECCEPTFDRRRICSCEECDGPLRLQTQRGSDDARRSWRNRSGEICFCI